MIVPGAASSECPISLIKPEFEMAVLLYNRMSALKKFGAKLKLANAPARFVDLIQIALHEEIKLRSAMRAAALDK